MTYGWHKIFIGELRSIKMMSMDFGAIWESRHSQNNPMRKRKVDLHSYIMKYKLCCHEIAKAC